MRATADSDFLVLTFGGVIFTRHARAFEALRECDRLLAAGFPAFFIGYLQHRLETGQKR